MQDLGHFLLLYEIHLPDRTCQIFWTSGLVHASNKRAILSCIHGITALGYGEPGLYFKAAAGRGSAAILFSFSADSNRGNAQVSSLMDAVKKAADFFGMEQFYFFGRVGKGLSPGAVSYTHLDVYKRQLL